MYLQKNQASLYTAYETIVFAYKSALIVGCWEG